MPLWNEGSETPKSKPPYPLEFRQHNFLATLARFGRASTQLSCEFKPSARSIAKGIMQEARDCGEPLPGKADQPEPAPQPKRAPAHYLWAVLIARIYEVFPLLCPICGEQMRIIAFITHSADIRQILAHIGVESEPPHIFTARGPPLWDDCGDAQTGEGVDIAPDWATDWDRAAQPAPEFDVDQRVNW